MVICKCYYCYYYYYYSLAILFIIYMPKQICSDQCENGNICPSPQLCCDRQCCLLYEPLDGSLPPHTTYPKINYYQLPFWNAWYFWFIAIFLIISCFGGCGYWRRRHLHFGTSHFQRHRCGSLTPIQDDPQGDADNEASHPPLRLLPIGNFFNPPPYNEVTSKPDMYPLVHGGPDLLKSEPLAFVYATSPFIHSYMPSNTGDVYVTSPAESNTSSLFQSTTASNYMYPPPYSDGVGVHPSVSTPGSILSACTPMDTSLSTQFLSSTSPPMATTPTSQQMLSEVTTPADSIASPTSLLVNGFRFYTDDSQLPVDPYTAQGGNLLANLVADIQNMTNRMIVSPASTNENIIGHSENDNGEHSVMLSPLSPPEVGSADDRSSCQPPGKRSRAVQIGTSSTTSDIMSPPSQDLSMDCGFGLSQSTSFYSHDFPSQDDVVEIDQWTMASVSRRSTGASDTMSIPSVSSNSRRNSNTDSSSIWHPHRVGTPRYLNQRTTTSPSESRIDERHLELNFTQIL